MVLRRNQTIIDLLGNVSFILLPDRGSLPKWQNRAKREYYPSLRKNNTAFKMIQKKKKKKMLNDTLYLTITQHVENHINPIAIKPGH